MTSNYPFAQSIIDSINPVKVACPVTKELYGYTKPVVDLTATMKKFADSYAQRKSSLGQKYPHTLPSIVELEYACEHYRSI
jgi:hypothetical protein